MRQYKGRVCFQGNRVTDQTATYAVFQELGSASALLEASKAVDTIAASPGFSGQQADARKAFCQAKLGGTPTWIELPRDQWPESWKGKFIRPVVLLRLALYGHPLSGVYWELHCNKELVKLGFEAVPGWEQLFIH